MSEQSKPPPHRWQPGESGNPRGRKPGPHTLARAVREAWPPERLVALATELAEHPEAAIRLRALEWLSDRAHGRAPVTIDATITTGHDIDGEAILARLSDSALRELLDAHEAHAIEATEPRALPVEAAGEPDTRVEAASPTEPPAATSKPVQRKRARVIDATAREHQPSKPLAIDDDKAPGHPRDTTSE